MTDRKDDEANEEDARSDRAKIESEVAEGDPLPRPAASDKELLLVGRSSTEILAKIVRGDPLGLSDLSVQRVSTRAIFLDPSRLLRRVYARVAYGASCDPLRGKPHLYGWLAARVDQSIRELIDEDAAAESRRVPLDPSDESARYFMQIAKRLHLDPYAARGACVRFNCLPEPTRQVFWSVILEGQEVEMCAHLGAGSVDEVLTHLHEAMVVFLEAGVDPSA